MADTIEAELVEDDGQDEGAHDRSEAARRKDAPSRQQPKAAPSDETPGRPPRKRSRPKRLGVWKLFAIIVIIAIVAVIAGGYFGSTTDSVLITNFNENLDGDGIDVEFAVVSTLWGHASGSGDVDISYAGGVVYAGSVDVENDAAYAHIPYTEFLIGSGEYTLTFEFDGKNAQKTFNPSTDFYGHLNVISDVEISMADPSPGALMDDNGYAMNITVFMLSEGDDGVQTPALAKNVKLSLYLQRGAGTAETLLDGYELDIGTGVYTCSYSYKTPGNYSVWARVQNMLCKAGSAYSDFTTAHIEYYDVNVLPMPHIEPSAKTEYNEGDRVRFDAFDSDPTDGDIVEYQWVVLSDYDDSWEPRAYGPEFNYTFPAYDNPDSDNGYLVQVMLVAVGDYILSSSFDEPCRESNSEILMLTVNEATIL